MIKPLSPQGMVFFAFVSLGALATALSYPLIQTLGVAAFLVAVAILGIAIVTFRPRMGRGEMSQVHLDTIGALAMAIDAKGQMASGHLCRVQAYAIGLGRLAGVDERTIEAVRAAALLHDVGKLAVPDYILNKPGPLTDVERGKLRTYPHIGAEILGHVDFPSPVIPVVRHHQERWDGSGYPDGLKGEQIPIGARILSIANAAAAMRSERTYRAALPREDMVARMRSEGGTHFDPALVESFCLNIEELDAAAAEVEMPVLSAISAARKEASELSDFARDLGTPRSLNLDKTLEMIMGRLRSLISFDTGSIYLVEEKTGLVIPAKTCGLNAEVIRRKSFRRGEGITGWVVDNGNTMVNVQPDLDFYGADIEIGRRYRSAIVVPLLVPEGCMGTITLYDRRVKHFGPEDERILERVVPQAAQSIQKARSHEETRDRAMTDMLTGLPNSRWLYMQLEQELSRARRTGKPLAVVVMDLDRFKPINDTYGHPVGDEVLRQVAESLRTQFRGMDSVCRWAGDEFVVLLPEADPQFVETSVSRVQMVIETMLVPTSMGRSVQVGVSAGWAVFPQDGEEFEELMRVADKRMDRNKSERHASGQTASA